MKQIKLVLISIFIFTLSFEATAQKELIKSGPMVGYSTMREVPIWIQTKSVAKIKIGYRIVGKNTAWITSKEHITTEEGEYIKTIVLTNLEPSSTYEYQIFANNKLIKFDYPLSFTTQTLWSWRMDPPDFSFIAGSCFYVNETQYDRPGKPYGGEYEILNHMYQDKPDFMVWLGDNTYLREVDYDSRSGIYHRQSHTRALTELQPFLANVHHYAIWDDHDYGPNDSDWTYPLKKEAKAAFKDFWPNNTYGAGGTEGITNSFYWNDCAFFMLDNRWYRSVDTSGSILGELQTNWLLESLKASRATFKFIGVGGQFLSDAQIFENFANYAKERSKIINFLDENDIKGVVFLTGDRHHSEITKLATPKGNIFYDVTSSAILSTTYDHENEPNTLRVKGSMISVKNYAKLTVSGPRKDRKLDVIFRNSSGEMIYEYKFDFKQK